MIEIRKHIFKKDRICINMRFYLLSSLLILFPFISKSQILAGTDDLGRTLPQNNSVGNPKINKQVGIFYFLWQGDATAENYWDLSEIIPNHPEVLEDYDNPFWGLPVYKPGGAVGMYYWGKPIYGYYRGDDYWVHLRSMQLLTDAGVDFLAIDATNTLVYPTQSNELMKAMDAVRAQGKKPPRIVYYTNTSSGVSMQSVYNNFYKPGAPYYHPECWYYLDGKPLIIGISKEAVGKDYESFFTYRESQWPNEAKKVNGWPWIEFTRPQKVYQNLKGENEIVNVSVCQHPNVTAGMGGAAFYGNMDNWGRSYRNGSHGNPLTDIAYGYNFQEQWDFALKQNVPFIYITGWNEWVAGRWDSKDGNPEHSWFCDAASPEYSRDAEPTLTDSLKDNYYMQIVSNVRRYKGIEPTPLPSPEKTINSFSDWSDVLPAYSDYTGETQTRAHAGAESKPAKTYINLTGRNDFRTLKVARDINNIVFYAETVDPITANTGSNWMRLYLDMDRNAKTGWLGYEYRVVGGNKLQKYVNGKWDDFKSTVVVVEGNKLMITIPFEYFGLENNRLDFEFKWSDNMQNDDDPLDWYVNGDVAPGGRLNYVYTAEWTEDQYRYAEFPKGVNPGLKCEVYAGIFDTIPSFINQVVSKTEYPKTLDILTTSDQNIGLKYTGFIDVPTKDTYTFTLNTDLSARLFIGNTLVVKSNAQGVQSNTIKLMPGKHAITVEYITKTAASRLLDIQINSSTLAKSPINSSMIFKYNLLPAISMTYNAIQNYFTTQDSVLNVKATDIDGSISKIELYDNQQKTGEETSTDFVIKNLALGDHSIYANVLDNDGAITVSGIMNFTVKSPISLPGILNGDEYRRGKNSSIITSTDSDGGKSLQVDVGWVDYPVNITNAGVYRFKFRVPSSFGSKQVTIKANNIEVGKVDLGYTGTSQLWYDITTDAKLMPGIQLLHFDFNASVIVHRIDVSYLSTAIETAPEKALIVTPNPSTTDFLVQTRNPTDRIIVYDMQGNIVDQQPIKESSFKRRVGSNLLPGVYLLVVTEQDGTKQTIKIIKN